MNAHFEKLRVDMFIDELHEKVKTCIAEKDYTEYIYLATIHHNDIMLFVVKRMEFLLGNGVVGEFLIETNNVLRKAAEDLKL